MPKSTVYYTRGSSSSWFMPRKNQGDPQSTDWKRHIR